MWAAQKDAFRRKVADSEAENIVSTITQTCLLIFLSALNVFLTSFVSSSSSLAATFDQTDQQREGAVQARRAFGL